ncbi:MAG TPA: NUDIX hydrolase [Mycobacteriales bacterium]|nr:NUDIX hydrolase [Mycobacteriales bacterium]
MTVPVIRAAGGVLWRHAEGGLEIAVVHRQRYDDWSMPKGKLADGEHPLHAAVREVVEETGVQPAVGRRLPIQEYTIGPDRKTVDYWAMAAPDGAEFRANDEVDSLRWMRPGEAATWLSYDRDRDLLRAFLAVPPPTGTVLLVRHGRAGSRASWSGEDLLRPLDAVGRRQAEALRAVLRWFGPHRVHSAELVRCVSTVAPLAQDLAVPVEAEPGLTEAAFVDDPERGIRRIAQIAAAGGRTVVCSQGGVIPDIVGTLAERHGVPVRRRRGKPPARKGSIWALSFVDGRLTVADYYPDLAPAAAVPPGPPAPVG